MDSRLYRHIRGNVVAYVALFFALSGGAVALQGKNTVDSGDIKKGQVKASDLGANSVSSPTVKDDSLTGTDIDESTLALPAQTASGPAGGDLSGSYPNPEIKAGAVGAAEVADGSLTTAQIDESTLFNDNSLNGSDVDESTLYNDNSLNGADINESTLYNDNSLNGTDIDESTLYNDNSLTGADIDESTLGNVPSASALNGSSTQVVNAHVAASGSRTLINNSFLPLNGQCSAGGEATMTIDNFVNNTVALYVDTGGADPVFSVIGVNGTSSPQIASTDDLQVWQAANDSGPLTNQATYIVGIDESGADCDFYVRGIFQNQN